MTPNPWLANHAEAIYLLLVILTVALPWLLLAAAYDPLAASYLPAPLLEVLQ